jgi:hypothetical protein
VLDERDILLKETDIIYHDWPLIINQKETNVLFSILLSQLLATVSNSKNNSPKAEFQLRTALARKTTSRKEKLLMKLNQIHSTLNAVIPQCPQGTGSRTPLWILKSTDAQVSSIKWLSICIEPTQIPPYMVNHLYIACNT